MAQAERINTGYLPSQIPRLTASRTPILLYKVKPADTLSQILVDFYDAPYGSPDYLRALTLTQYVNPELSNPNVIFPGQVIRLYDLAQGELAYCPAPTADLNVNRDIVSTWLNSQNLHLPDTGKYQHYLPSDETEREAFSVLAWGEQNYGLLSTAAAAGFNGFDGVMSQANRALVAEVKILWQDYQQGRLTKHQYDYRRRVALKTYASKVGPMEKILFKGKTTRQAVRINRRKAIPATQKIDNQLGRLSRLAKLSKSGGVVLTAAGVGMGCYQIANTEDRHEKNEILVETLAGTTVGLVASTAMSILLFSNPVGWGVALAVGAGAAIGSYAAGKGAVKLYNTVGEGYDLVGLSGTDSICR